MKSPIVSIICLATVWIGGMYAVTITPTERPKLNEIPKDILEMISGADYSMFGICLLDDDDGRILEGIKKNNPLVEDRVYQIFQKWLKSNPDGKWEDIVKCLQNTGLNYAASKIEEMYDKGTCQRNDRQACITDADEKLPRSNYDGAGSTSVQDTTEEPPVDDNEGARNTSVKGSEDHLSSLSLKNPKLICKRESKILDCIKQNQEARGLAIIVTNDYRMTRQQSFELNTEIDGKHLTETLNALSFIVLWLHNVNKSDLSLVIEEVVDLEGHANYIKYYKCILFAFSAHGSKNNYITLYNEQEVDLQEDILDILLSPKHTELARIPKILLIDACRGDLQMHKSSDSSQFPFQMKTRPVNLLLAYATLPGFVSYSYRYTGSPWMQEVAKQLRSSTENIQTVLTDVNAAIDNMAEYKPDTYQVPVTYSSLARRVYMNDTSAT